MIGSPFLWQSGGILPSLAIALLCGVLSALATLVLLHLLAGARARAARRRFGLQDDAKQVTRAGRIVTLRGTLEARGTPCMRYDDGGEAAAATVRVGSREEHDPARGRSQHSALDARMKEAVGQASVRAETLVLRMDGGTVRLEGPVRVVVGSREVSRGGRLQRLGDAVLARIGETDTAVEYLLRHRPARARFRSVAGGDRVIVAGVLQQSATDADDAVGYRRAATRYCLVAPVSGARSLFLAFAGSPHGPRRIGAVLSGALAGVLASAGVLAWGTDRPAGYASGPDGEFHAVSSPREKYESYDLVERSLDAGDFEEASRALRGTYLEERFAAEVHLIAGKDALAADAVAKYAEAWPTLAMHTGCVRDALLLRGTGEGASEALARLRAAVHEGSPRSLGCGLLLADGLRGKERIAVLDALPSTEGRAYLWRRIRFLLEIEAGRAPHDEPPGEGSFPDPMGLLYRSVWSQRRHLLDLHIASATLAAPSVSTKSSPFVAARAAHLLSALGDPEGARRFWDAARAQGPNAVPDELRALRVAIELRAGDRAAARRFIDGLPVKYDVATMFALLEGDAVDPAWVRDHSNPRALSDLLKEGDDGTQIAAQLTAPRAFGDGELLFLIAPRLRRGRERLLSWVSAGNPDRDRHDGKGPPPPADAIDRLMRLEERRQIAAALDDADLARSLAAGLRRGRSALLRRDVAVLAEVIHDAGMGH